MMAADRDYRFYLTRAGWMALGLAAIDVAVLVVALLQQKAASGFGIIGVVLGPMLPRGNLSTATFMRKGGTFYLAAGISGLMLYLAFNLLGMVKMDFAQHLAIALAGMAYAIGVFALLFLIVRDVNRPIVLAAARAAGEKPTNLLWPALAGIVLVFGLGIAVAFNPNPIRNAPALPQQTP